MDISRNILTPGRPVVLAMAQRYYSGDGALVEQAALRSREGGIGEGI